MIEEDYIDGTLFHDLRTQQYRTVLFGEVSSVERALSCLPGYLINGTFSVQVAFLNHE